MTTSPSLLPHLPNNAVRDKFAAGYTVLGNIWEALSPDTCLSPYEKDFKWLTQVYESVKPVNGNGRPKLYGEAVPYS